ncbi:MULTISPECIES: class I SAM-dependent methyltransferase [Nocardia]|uniref:class I SAM-dependent methyltransferase n=1 Tax=Nocardia TaxID=1817 RepID=UPI00245864DB|nr:MULTISPECIES: methyltransferase domain-containing protein [Nocardia]
MTATGLHDEPRRTRPGTPMIGEYSINQMDDFYAALRAGQVKQSGIMNLMQRLIIAEHCKSGDKVVDACCGSGLQLPVLYRYRPDLGSYLGLDISAANLRGAVERQQQLDEQYGARFPITFLTTDVSQPWNVGADIDVVIYTSALEHLPYPAGLASLRHAANALSEDGRLLLSTPNTAEGAPLQHRVHVYEWPRTQLLAALDEVGLAVCAEIGILPPAAEVVEQVLTDRFGGAAARLYRQLASRVPDQLLGPVIAAALGESATETLYVCERKAPS